MRTQQSSAKLVQNFTICRLLGSGAYGVVVEGKSLKNNESVAIKISGADGNEWLREVENLQKMPPHPNVVRYYTCWQDTLTASDLENIKLKLNLSPTDKRFSVPRGRSELRVLCIQMELCEQDLRAWLGSHPLVDINNVKNMFLQICRGLQHIHAYGRIHRDLKPDNIFLAKGNSSVLKIGDLGIATEHKTTNSATHTFSMGTPLYLAPEQASRRYGKPADLYALGLILFELVHPKLQPSWNNGSYDFICQSFVNLKYNNEIPQITKSQWPKISDLILKLIRVDPNERPKFEEIYEILLPARVKVGAAAGGQLPPPPRVQMKPNDMNEEKVKVGEVHGNNIPKIPIRKEIKGAQGAAAKRLCALCARPCEKDPPHEIRGKFYCNADYMKLLSPKCKGCGKEIMNEYEEVSGVFWHRRCFVCSRCRRNLKGMKNFEYQGQIYCRLHYNEKSGLYK